MYLPRNAAMRPAKIPLNEAFDNVIFLDVVLTLFLGKGSGQT